MDILEKAELTASILYIARFLKSGIPIYNSEVPDKAGRKTKENTLQSVLRFTQTQQGKGHMQLQSALRAKY